MKQYNWNLATKMIITLKKFQEEKIQASKGKIAARDEWQDKILVLWSGKPLKLVELHTSSWL
jgi:hypothetical protein